MTDLDINQKSTNTGDTLGSTSSEASDVKILKVGAGSTVFYTDKEGSRWGSIKFEDANAFIKTDGSFKFKAADGSIIMDSLGDGGNFLNVINSALNTSSKKILTDFTFESTDYSGAFKAGNPTWDENTGLITGGSGVLINAAGILGANAGVATFTLDAATGNATFAGTLAAATGTIGAITLASGGNIKAGKTAYTDDTNAGFWLGLVTGVAKFNLGASATKYFHYDGTDFTLTGGDVQTNVSGYRLKMNSATNKFECLNNDTVLGYFTTSADGNVIIAANDDVYFWAGGAARAHVGSGGVFSTDFRCSDNYKSSDGSNGEGISSVHMVTYVGYNSGGNHNYRKDRTLTFKNGLLTSISGESGEINW